MSPRESLPRLFGRVWCWFRGHRAPYGYVDSQGLVDCRCDFCGRSWVEVSHELPR